MFLQAANSDNLISGGAARFYSDFCHSCAISWGLDIMEDAYSFQLWEQCLIASKIELFQGRVDLHSRRQKELKTTEEQIGGEVKAEEFEVSSKIFFVGVFLFVFMGIMQTGVTQKSISGSMFLHFGS